MGRLSGQDRLETKIDSIQTDTDSIETKVDTVDTVVDGIETHVHSIETKVDTLDTIIDDLHNTDIPDIHTDVADLHTDIADIHTDLQTTDNAVDAMASNLTQAMIMGNVDYYDLTCEKYVAGFGTDNLIENNNLTPITVVGGNNAFGTQKLLHDGGGHLGSANYYQYFKNIIVTAVTTANVSNVVTLAAGTLAAAVACTLSNSGDTVNKTAHGLLNDSLVMFSSLTDETKGVTTKIVYYIVNKADDTFQVSLTSGGAAVEITADISGEYKAISSNYNMASILVSESATAVSSHYYPISGKGMNYNKAVWAKAKSASGHTSTISFYLDYVPTGYNSGG